MGDYMKILFSNITLRQKLLVSFAIILLLLMVMGLSFTHKLSRVDAETADIVNEIQPTLVATKQLENNLLQMSMHLGLYMLDKESYHINDFEKFHAALISNMETIEQSEVARNDQEVLAVLESISSHVDKFIGFKPEVMELVKDNSKNVLATKYATDEVNPLAMEISQLLSEMIQVEEDEEGGLILVADTEIKAGEELTIDYGYEDIYDDCGCNTCDS